MYFFFALTHPSGGVCDVTLAISNAIQTQTLIVLELTLSGLILLLHDKSLQQFPLQPESW